MFERFHADWTPDLSYRWQQNRAVVGHNLKIAWNLTRCAYYFQTRAKRLRDAGQGRRKPTATIKRSDRCLEVAKRLADRMGEVGLDKIRGGIFDCVERKPSGGMPTQFAWGATKDFWQQEQGILAYLILYGATGNPHYLQLARESSAFWNLFFLDLERQGYFFRTTENGLPILAGQYGMKSSHAIGYHAFELAYLAHLYTRTYVAAGGGSDNSFCLYFKICSIKQQKSINVLPDFMPPGRVRITSVRANGMDVTEDLDPANLVEYQIPTDAMTARPDERDGRTRRRVPRDPSASLKQRPFRRLRWPISRSPARRSPSSSRASTSRARSRSIRNASPATARPSIWCRACGASRSSAFTAPSSPASSIRSNGWRSPRTSTNVNLDDYAAVIAAANYTTVRLRWSERETSPPAMPPRWRATFRRRASSAGRWRTRRSSRARPATPCGC